MRSLGLKVFAKTENEVRLSSVFKIGNPRMKAIIIELVRKYIRQQGVDYGIMINGKWGVGKTYFAQHELYAVLRDLKMEPVYVSLNGVKSFEEVATQIVFGTHWKFTQKFAQSFLLPFAEKYLPEKTLSALLTGLRLTEECKAQNPDKIVSTVKDLSQKKHVIFIDDVERVNDIELLLKILGRLYDEFICKGYHVIFLGDETKIEPKSRYFSEREKYVRHNLTFVTDIPLVIEQLVNLRTGKEKKYARGGLELLKDFCAKLQISNIRIIKRLLDDYVWLSSKIRDEAVWSKIHKQLFNAYAPIGYEVALGNLPDMESGFCSLSNIDQERYAVRLRSLAAGTEQERLDADLESYAQKFIEKYDGVLSYHWTYHSVVVKYAVYGVVALDELKEMVQAWMPKKTDHYLQAIQVLRDYENVDDETLSQSVTKVFEGLKEGVYSAEYILLSYELLQLVKKVNYVVPWRWDDGLQSAKDSVAVRFKKVPDDYINPVLLRMDCTDAPRKEICQLIRKEDVRQRKGKTEETVEAFFDALNARDEARACSLCCPQSGCWHLFQEIDELNQLDRLCTLNNFGINFLGKMMMAGVGFELRFEDRDLPIFDELTTRLRKTVVSEVGDSPRRERLQGLIRKIEEATKILRNKLFPPKCTGPTLVECLEKCAM